MKLTSKQKLFLLIATLATILILTNPSIKSFEEYLGLEPIVRPAIKIRKEKNFIFCSIYSEGQKGRRFFGILANFYEINSLSNGVKETNPNSLNSDY